MGLPELPVFKKCCCCIPLRYGLLTWGYIRVILAICAGIAAIRLSFGFFLASVFSKEDSRVQYLIFTMLAAFLMVTSVADVILNVIFIVSGHQKDKNLMRGYYVYSLLLCVLTTVMFVAGAAYFFFMFASTQNVLLYDVYLLLMFIAFILIQITVQGYFILLIRSEIIKLRSNSQFRFVNNSGESECCMKGDEEVALGTEGTENNCKDNSGAKGNCEFVGYVARNNEY